MSGANGTSEGERSESSGVLANGVSQGSSDLRSDGARVVERAEGFLGYGIVGNTGKAIHD